MSTPGPALTCSGVTVRFGKKLACDSVNLSCGEGEIFALLGRNGAGKSSIVSCLLGFRLPDLGSATLLGHDSWSRRAVLDGRVGSVPEEPNAPANLNARQLGNASSWLMPRWDGAAYADRLARFRVPKRTAFGRLSKGEKSLLQLALALGHSPELLVLDDPTLGLDPIARDLVFEEIRSEHAARRLTVFLTTHEIASVEGLAHRVAILREGRVVSDGCPGEVAHAAGCGTLPEAFAAVAMMSAAP